MTFNFSPRTPISGAALFSAYFPTLLRSWLLLGFFIMLSSAGAIAQKSDESPQDALDNAFAKGNLMAALSGHHWRPGLSLTAARLSVGQTVSLDVSLNAGTDYVFLASGATERTDADLYLRDESGKLLAEDRQDDGTPIVEFTPAQDGIYRIQLHLAAGNQPDLYVALGLLRRDGRQISEQSYRSVTSGFFPAAEEIRASGAGADWQNPGEWCVFGYCLGEKEGFTVRGLQPDPGRKLITAAAGPESTEISLYLATEAGSIVATTERPGAFPLLSYQSPLRSVLELRIEADRFKSHILVLIGVFQQ